MHTRSIRVAVALALLAATVIAARPLGAESPAGHWHTRLSGARLTAYHGTILGAHGQLDILTFCRTGRFRRERNGHAPAAGTWRIEARAAGIVVVYTTDEGVIHFEAIGESDDGRLDLGGMGYAVEVDGAGC